MPKIGEDILITSYDLRTWFHGFTAPRDRERILKKLGEARNKHTQHDRQLFPPELKISTKRSPPLSTARAATVNHVDRAVPFTSRIGDPEFGDVVGTQVKKKVERQPGSGSCGGVRAGEKVVCVCAV